VLDLAAAGRRHLQIGWFVNSIGCLLEQSPGLTSPAWQLVTNTPSFVGNRFTVGLEGREAQRFFRLHRQWSTARRREGGRDWRRRAKEKGGRAMHRISPGFAQRAGPGSEEGL
jgi:hypothetical protein